LYLTFKILYYTDLGVTVADLTPCQSNSRTNEEYLIPRLASKALSGFSNSIFKHNSYLSIFGFVLETVYDFLGSDFHHLKLCHVMSIPEFHFFVNGFEIYNFFSIIHQFIYNKKLAGKGTSCLGIFRSVLLIQYCQINLINSFSFKGLVKKFVKLLQLIGKLNLLKKWLWN